MEPLKITIQETRVPHRDTSSRMLRSATARPSRSASPRSAQHGAHDPTLATSSRQHSTKRKNVDQEDKREKVRRGDIPFASKYPIDYGTGMNKRNPLTD